MNESENTVGHTTYANQMTVNPIGISAVIILGLCVIFLPRKWSVIPMLIIGCFIPSAQRIVVAGLDFDFLRIMVLFGVLRLILKKEYVGFVWRPLDTAMVLWTISSAFIFTFREGNFPALVNRLGFAFDSFGMYFLFRCLVKNWLDADRIILGLAWISIPVMGAFVLEQLTGRNIFSTFGGVPEITMVREGRLRCQGAFSHPIIAGCFWASLLPLFAACWWRPGPHKRTLVFGLFTGMVIVLCCASSTPVVGVMAAMAGGVAFYLRNYLRSIRWGIFLSLVSLHIVMKGPVWSLIARIRIVGGSTGWHRSNLIQEAVNHFGDWMLWGCSADAVLKWGIFKGDVTNQFILEAINGGLVTLSCFIAIIVLAFREVGFLWHSKLHNRYLLALSWALGVSLFVHCINFLGVAYFGQIFLLWYLLLAIIGSLSSYTRLGPGR